MSTEKQETTNDSLKRIADGLEKLNDNFDFLCGMMVSNRAFLAICAADALNKKAGKELDPEDCENMGRMIRQAARQGAKCSGVTKVAKK